MSRQLRFAALIRVSTEKQTDKKHESLLTQTDQLASAVQSLGGRIVRTYGGQEHATPGFEHAQVKQLLKDAQDRPRPFDAVIVAHPDRWSRDNAQSKHGLSVLQEAGVQFFVLTTEQDLFDPTVKLFLGMSAEIGEYQAAIQAKKSIENRIHRAKRGFPTAGKLPYGRTFKDGQWGLDPAKVRIIRDIARRYLSGEKLPDLAEEYKMNHSNLHKVLMHRCGPVWSQRLRIKKFKIDETVEITIPRLLDDQTIQALRNRAAANKTYYHGPAKVNYLLSHVVFCEACGYAMFGQVNSYNLRYYRHAHHRRDRVCSNPVSHVPADALESAVMERLFEAFGNAKALDRAVQRAIPNLDRINDLKEQIGRMDAELSNIEQARSKLLDRLTKGLIDDSEMDAQLARTKARREKLQEQRTRLADSLAKLPAPEAVKTQGKGISASIRALIRAHAKTDLAEMSYEDQRALVESVFGGSDLDGKRLGVYVTFADNKQKGTRHPRYKFTIKGQLIEQTGLVGTKSARY